MTRTRLLAALVMAPLAIAAVLLLPTPWMAAVSAAAFLVGLWEWLRLTDIEDPIARGVLLLVNLLVMVALVWASRSNGGASLVLFAFVIGGLYGGFFTPTEAAVVAAVLGFGSSSALASAYGIAVTLTMLITTVLTFFVVRHGWGLPAPVAYGATIFFLALDALLVAGCAVKLFDGGWMPLALAGWPRPSRS